MIRPSFKDTSNKLNDLKLPGFDMVLGIAEGGVIPAALTAYKLKCLLLIERVKYRDRFNKPMFETPVIDGEIAIPKGVKRILLVDDLSKSGKTLKIIKSHLSTFEVKTFVFIGKADYCLFPEITECVHWPWKWKK
ncbi:phosphoribosyltransferase [Patescibacteria group bacterium]